MDKEVVKELIQKEMNVNNLTRELNKLLNNEATQRQISEDYIQLQNILNAGGMLLQKPQKSLLHQLLNNLIARMMRQIMKRKILMRFMLCI